MSRGGSSAAAASWPDRMILATSCLLMVAFLARDVDGSKFFPITTTLIGISTGSVGTSSNGNSNSTETEDTSGNVTMRCDDARLRCAYRTGCGRALQHYLTRCASVLQGDGNECPENCQHALIGLMSTDEGKELMTCDCEKEDIMCYRSKQRAEVCRASVTATMNRTRVSCRVATWICNADALCSTALQYYNENCKRMFHGKKCTKRCRNSINILRRQEKAAKLNTCFCDGAEEYDCIAIHSNMDVLCFNRPAQHHNYQEHQLGSGSSSSSAGGSGNDGGSGANGDTRTNRISGAASQATRLGSGSEAWRILLLGLVLLLHSVHLGE